MAATYPDLVDELVVVTGGGSGIGRSVCQLLAETGARVVITDLALEKAKETQTLLKDPDKHVAFQLDVSSLKSVDELINYIENNLKQCPLGVVNSAGIAGCQDGSGRKSCLQANEKEWDLVVGVNLKGTFLVDIAFAKLLRKHNAKRGSIVNIQSNTRWGYPPFIEYSASKAGISGITKTLAEEMGQYNIRVNAVAPGFTKTPMTANVSEELGKELMSNNPLRRQAQPEEIATVCVFLMSDASSYVTGQTINACGGHHVSNILPHLQKS